MESREWVRVTVDQKEWSNGGPKGVETVWRVESGNSM